MDDWLSIMMTCVIISAAVLPTVMFTVAYDGAVALVIHWQIYTTDCLCDEGMSGGLWQDPGTEGIAVIHSLLCSYHADRHGADGEPCVCACDAH